MTDSPNSSMSPEQLARLEKLQRRSGLGAQPPSRSVAAGVAPGEVTSPARSLHPPRRRRHPALSTKIAVTGISSTALLGIITGLGYSSSAASTTETVAAVEPVATQTAVTAPAATVPTGALAAEPIASCSPVQATTPAPETGVAVADTTPAAEPEPVALTATPIVRQVVVHTAAPAAARTSGSR